MELAQGETVIYEGHPSARSVLEIYVKGDVLALIVGAALWFAVAPGAGVAAFVVIAVGAALYSSVKRRATDYMVTNQRLYIRRGIFSRNEQHARLERVQDVTTRQSFFERLLRIGSVDFDTAGGDNDEAFSFAGIDDPREVVAAVNTAQRGLTDSST